MSESVDGVVVGVVGDVPAAVRTAVESAGVDAVTGTPETVLAAEPTHVVAVGSRALQSLVETSVPAAPVLAVDAGPGLPSLPEAAAATGIEAFVAGEFDTVETPVVAVAVDGDRRTHALSDVMLVTAEPARISEYVVRTPAHRVAEFRADGVVVATPLGSHGYARRVDGPVVAPGTGVAAVVPVAPFATDSDHWALPLDAIELRVARDEHAVELHADDRTVGPIQPNVPVTISVAGQIRLASVSESDPVFEASDQH